MYNITIFFEKVNLFLERFLLHFSTFLYVLQKKIRKTSKNKIFSCSTLFFFRLAFEIFYLIL